MSCKIECEWLRKKKIVINPDGQVWPCCYLANSGYMFSSLDFPKEYEPKSDLGIEDQLVNIEEAAVNTGYNHLFRKYYQSASDHNIFNNNLSSILNSEWFAKTLPDSWLDEEKVLHQCKIFCSK